MPRQQQPQKGTPRRPRFIEDDSPKPCWPRIEFEEDPDPEFEEVIRFGGPWFAKVLKGRGYGKSYIPPSSIPIKQPDPIIETIDEVPVGIPMMTLSPIPYDRKGWGTFLRAFYRIRQYMKRHV